MVIFSYLANNTQYTTAGSDNIYSLILSATRLGSFCNETFLQRDLALSATRLFCNETWLFLQRDLALYIRVVCKERFTNMPISYIILDTTTKDFLMFFL